MGKNKRRKNYYIQSAKRRKLNHNVLRPGLRGYLCMCNSHEKDCVREAYNILNQFGDKLYGPEQLSAESKQEKDDNGDCINGGEEKVHEDTTAASVTADIKKEKEDSDENDDEMDIDAALKADLKEMQTPSSGQPKEQKKENRRFQQVASGANNCIFIKTTLTDPLPLSLAIMDHILDTQEQCTKRLIRLIPVHASCKAFPEDIEKAVRQLIEGYFTEGKTFYIGFKARNNNSITRDVLLTPLIKIIQEAHPKNSPDMKNPDVVLNLEVIKSICCISLLPQYFTKYWKYNLVGLATNKGEISSRKRGENRFIEGKPRQGKDKQSKDQNGTNIKEEIVEDEAELKKEKDESRVAKEAEKAGVVKEEEAQVKKEKEEEGVTDEGGEAGIKQENNGAGIAEEKGEEEAGGGKKE